MLYVGSDWNRRQPACSLHTQTPRRATRRERERERERIETETERTQTNREGERYPRRR
jgi:hypothetical protein